MALLKRNLVLLLSHLFLFCLGILFVPIARNVKSTLSSNQIINSSECSGLVQELDYIPAESLLVIGHAYGSPGDPTLQDKERLMDVAVHNVLKKNKANIDRVVFTGDILFSPSVRLWKLFFSSFDSLDLIDIAPGNHDIGVSDDNALRDIFIPQYSKFKNVRIEYPYHFFRQGQWFVIDNSSSPGSLQRLRQFLVKNTHLYRGRDVFVLRHHLAKKSLSRFANSSSNPDVLLDANEFLSLKYTLGVNSIGFIYGDTGAFDQLPRIVCESSQGVSHIANGIGGLDDDMVLLINNGKIFSYNLRKYRVDVS